MRIRKHHLALGVLLASSSVAVAAAVEKQKPTTDEPLGPPVQELPLHKLSASDPQIGPIPSPEAPPPKPKPGTIDAPVDGLDGKPHTGPLIPFDKATAKPKTGTGSGHGGVKEQIPEVGISGGGSSVDISKPPPVTGEHEITNLEGKEGIKEGGKGTKGGHDELDVGTGLSKEKSKDPDAVPEEGATGKKGKEDGKVPEGFEDKPKFEQKEPDTESRPPPSRSGSGRSSSTTTTPSSDSSSEEEGTIDSPFHSYTLSFIMILFSEIGDKTFLIAALMAMRHPRFVVFSAAFCSLVVMSVVSAMLGHAVPALLPKKFTSFLAAGLFLVFGVRMMNEGLKMEKGTNSVREEMKEVEQELEEKEAEIIMRSGSLSSRSLEEGGGGIGSSRGPPGGRFQRATSSPNFSDSEAEDKKAFKPRRGGGSGGGGAGVGKSKVKGHGGGSGSILVSAGEGVQNLAALLLSPAWVQTFVMTFLGEWGDRSQIATIAMAAGQDYWWVTLGTITGHSICTAGAVLGGKFLASKISVRNVTLGGACTFLIFGVIYFMEAVYM